MSKQDDPVYALNSYVWRLVSANLGWSKEDYSNLTPIIPTQQMPQLMETGRPFIVYGAAGESTQHLYALKSDTIAYNIFAAGPGSESDINDVVDLLRNVFERQDEAAAYVNEHLDREAAAGIVPRRNVSFASVRFLMSEKPNPSDEEGGFVSSMLLVRVLYTQNVPDPVVTDFDYS